MAGFPNLLGGLLTIGGQGAAGAATGQVQGVELARKMNAEDLQSQLRILDAAIKGQQLRQMTVPTEEIYNNVIYRKDPTTGRLTQVGTVQPPPTPMSALDTAAIAEFRQRNPGATLMDYMQWKWDRQHPQRPVSVPPGGNLIDPNTHQPVYSAPPKPERPISVPPGGTLIDPNTHQPVFTAPAKATKEPTSFDALVAKANDPTVPPIERARAREQADAIQNAHLARQRAGRVDKADEPLLAQAAHWTNAQGQHPSPLQSARSANAAGFYPFQGKVAPEVSTRVTIGAVDQVLGLLPALKAKSLVMSSSTLWSKAWTAFQRGIVQPGDPDLTNFMSHTSSLIRTARELGDIGFRAQAAITGTTNLIEKAQTAAGIEQALTQLRNLLTLAAPSTIPRTLTVYDTRSGKHVNVTFDPGETLDKLPEWADPNR